MTSNNSGAKSDADRAFDAHFRDENGKIIWDRIREYAARPGAKRYTSEEFFKKLHEIRLKAIAERKKLDDEGAPA